MTWAPGSSPSPRRAWPSRFRRVTNSGQAQTRSPSMSAGLSGWRAAWRARMSIGSSRLLAQKDAPRLLITAGAPFCAVDAPPRVELRLVLRSVAHGKKRFEACALIAIAHVHVHGVSMRCPQRDVGVLPARRLPGEELEELPDRRLGAGGIVIRIAGGPL